LRRGRKKGALSSTLVVWKSESIFPARMSASGAFRILRDLAAQKIDAEHYRVAILLTDFRDVTDCAGTVNERKGKFAQSIEATLNGDDMQVEPAGPQERTATTAEPVEWEWKLTPQSGGDKTLTVEVAANIQVGPDKRRVQVRTLHEPITIRVSTFQQIKMYVAQVNGIVVAAATTITALAGIFGFVPPVRDFLLKLFRWRRRNGAA